jgi:uncharacterized protein
MRFGLGPLLLTVILTTEGWPASFDCAKAKSKVEKAICADPDLSKMDEQLGTVYKTALATHPLPSYVKARQIEWLKDLPKGDSPGFVARLQEKYRDRIAHLKNASLVAVYSDAQEKFSYDNGDAVAELWSGVDGKIHLSVWGGFQVDFALSRANDREIHTGCEFEGSVAALKSQGKNTASSAEGDQLSFTLKPASLSFDAGNPGCFGNARLQSDEFRRILK